jgi:hypothetical protein
MTSSRRLAGVGRLGVGAAVLFFCAALPAVERQKDVRGNTPRGDVVELFQGIEDGQIEVQFIPRSSKEARLLVSNKTDKPISVKLPTAFFGAPVLAQIQPVQPAVPRQPAQFQQQPNPFLQPGPFRQPVPPVTPPDPRAPQRLGVAPQQVFFNVPPEKVGQVKLEAICLDHGNPNPRAAMKYEIRPISELAGKQGLAEVLESLGRGEIDHTAAQLAAWHLSNDMSWEKLAGLREHQPLVTKPTYTKKEIEAGKKAAQKAADMAEQRRLTKST